MPFSENFIIAVRMCGGTGPQVHHIDEDPTHNELLNLLPLCPSCHLRDLHDPTAPVDRGKRGLFRRHRDPMILHDRFQPLRLRCRLLLEIEARSLNSLEADSEELMQFVSAFAMGPFYAARLKPLLQAPHHLMIWSTDTPQEVHDQREREELAEYRALLSANRETALSLVVEMLRYQDWPMNKPDS